MKPVHNDRPRSELTMTVGELRDALSNYEDDVPVIATWEGIYRGFRVDGFWMEEVNCRTQLTIDVEN